MDSLGRFFPEQLKSLGESLRRLSERLINLASLPNLSVTRKVTIAYLLIVFCSVLALGNALSSLYQSTARAERLVSVDFRALNLARALQQKILAQERLEKQQLILKDNKLLELLLERQTEFWEQWEALDQLPLETGLTELLPIVTKYLELANSSRSHLEQSEWKAAQRLINGPLGELRLDLLTRFETLENAQEEALDRALLLFSQQSERAYWVTLAVAFLGVFLSAPVALAVLLSIHRSIKALVQATKDIAAGSFQQPLVLNRKDEFGLLAREFVDMGRKLEELEQQRLDANPLTHLPGNLAIDREIETRLIAQRPFAHLYVDLDNFKAFGDRYGYQSGSDAIALVGDMIRASVKEHGTEGDLAGHIGGDDYVVLTEPDRGEAIARDLIARFDAKIPELYSEEDRQAGFFTAKDRFGVERQFPLLTMSIAILLSSDMVSPSIMAIGRECAKMKAHLKKLPGSNFLVNRRQNLQ